MPVILAATSVADADFRRGSVSAGTTAGRIDPNVLEGLQSTGDGGHDYFLPTKLTDFWFSGSYWSASMNAMNFPALQFLDRAYSDVNPLFDWVYNSATPNANKIRAWDGSAKVDLGPEVGSLGGANVRTRIDVHIKIADTGGIAEVYCNGALGFSFSGDTKLVESGGVDLLRLHAGRNSGFDGCWSAIMIANEDTRGMSFLHKKPGGAGALNEWSGTFASVNENGFNDSTVAASGTPGQMSLYTKTALPAAYNTGYTVEALVLSGRMLAGKASIHGAVRSGGTNYQAAKMRSNPAMGAGRVVIDKDPATGAKWTFADVDAAQIGMKLV